MPLGKDEKKTLLQIARAAIEGRAKEGKALSFGAASPGLLEKRGAFVTLRKGGDLRGCVGVFGSDKSLCETVGEMAVAAAMQDQRFAPVETGESAGITIEISALTPLKKISDVREIEVGRHGLYIVRGRMRGVLLPQVATECGFDRDTFLDQTCLKAGLPPGAWKAGADVYVFEAEVFSEGGEST